MDFSEALTVAYLERPGQVLPNALWKSRLWAAEYETHFAVSQGMVSQLLAWNETRLMLCWTRDRDVNTLPLHTGMNFQFALLHQDFSAQLDREAFISQTRFFRLVHSMCSIPDPVLPAGFSYAVADPVREAQEISDLICACYDDLKPTPASIRSWMAHPVFEPDLWVWVIDERRGLPAGLGIAELDTSIAEGSLEWIQILPAYRGRGLGASLVSELLRRLVGRAAFTTVAGQVENQTHPDKLYRRCGFEGDDIFWVLQGA